VSPRTGLFARQPCSLSDEWADIWCGPSLLGKKESHSARSPMPHGWCEDVHAVGCGALEIDVTVAASSPPHFERCNYGFTTLSCMSCRHELMLVQHGRKAKAVIGNLLWSHVQGSLCSMSGHCAAARCRWKSTPAHRLSCENSLNKWRMRRRIERAIPAPADNHLCLPARPAACSREVDPRSASSAS
jgi:hypothetical protein